MGIILVGGFVAGIIFFMTFHFTMAYSNKMDLCLSCHEMTPFYEEYKKSPHYNNPSGVRATCSDCHVPHDKDIFGWFDKLYFKITIGGKDIYHHLKGTYDTREKINAARWELANNVWKNMKERDSKECRFCHQFEAMDLEKQDRTAAKKHGRAMEEGKTCIDCHKGIAHEEPEEPDEPEKK
ncbi:MAG: cytochrome C [Magnetococcales bacterium]|nr:cytochrome C [Magnetococcales bacterium]